LAGIEDGVVVGYISEIRGFAECRMWVLFESYFGVLVVEEDWGFELRLEQFLLFEDCLVFLLWSLYLLLVV
jgi:hypothetical protein